MKIFLLIFSIVYSLFSFSQKNNSSVHTIIENMKIQEKTWNDGNIKAFMKYYWHNDSLKFIGSKGITYGWQKTLDNYLKSYPTKKEMGILTFTIIECTQLSETSIYVIGKWNLKKEGLDSLATNKVVGGHFTLLWKKIHNNWLIVADHTS